MSMAGVVKGELVSRIRRAPGIESFRFKMEKKIKFIPGQFLQFILDEENEGNRELNKYLSFSSSPLKDYVEVTKRLSKSLFSKCLAELEIVQKVKLKLPFGNCVFLDEYKK